MKYEPEIALGYEDVYLVPNKNVVESRKEVSTEYSILLPRPLNDKEWEDTWPKCAFYVRDSMHPLKRFGLPIIPANMRSVVNLTTYEKYVDLGLMPIMHRFDVNPISFLQSVKSNWKAISIGVTDNDYGMLQVIRKLPIHQWPDCICIDIAHGHSDKMVSFINSINIMFSMSRPLIIAGNVTTPEAVLELQEAGADMIKVGIGGGQVCSTRNKTGFHVPMFTAVMQCAAVAKVPIIADGGIRENGDIAKALLAGASMVMIGGLFAACTDSPAAIIDGKKEYYGSASAQNKGYNRNIEGFAIHLTPTMTIEEKVQEITQDLQSAITYAGGKDLKALDLSRIKYNIVK